LALYAKELCPEAVVEVSATSYEDEDGHVDIFSLFAPRKKKNGSS
jgi:hypothetical protein